MEYPKYKLSALILAVSLIIVSFANSNDLIRVIFYIIFASSLILLPIIKNKFYLSHKNVLISGLILILYNLFIILVYFDSYASAYNGLLYCTLILFFMILISIDFNKKIIDDLIVKMSLISKVLFIIGFILLLIVNPSPWISGTSFLFLFLYFIFVDKKTTAFSKIIFTTLWLIIVYLDTQRTFLLIFPLFLILIFSWGLITKKRKWYQLLFLSICILLAVIPWVYVLLSLSTYRDTLDQLAIMYTNSRFFSERDIIWANLYRYYLEGNIFLGGGHHITPDFVYGSEFSAHNTYVAIITRTGIIGFLLFLNYSRNIWKSFYEYKDYSVVKYSAIFFIISLLKQSSEISLIGNNVALAMGNWFIVALGLMYINSLKKEKQENKSTII